MGKYIITEPTEATWINGRKIKYYVCEPNEEDIEKRNDRLRKQAKERRVKVVRKSATGHIKYFSSVEAAASASGVSRSSVSKCLNGHQKTAGGYKFMKKGEKQ